MVGVTLYTREATFRGHFTSPEAAEIMHAFIGEALMKVSKRISRGPHEDVYWNFFAVTNPKLKHSPEIHNQVGCEFGLYPINKPPKLIAPCKLAYPHYLHAYFYGDEMEPSFSINGIKITVEELVEDAHRCIILQEASQFQLPKAA